MRIDVDLKEAVSISKLHKSVRLKIAALVDNPEDFVPARDVPSVQSALAKDLLQRESSRAPGVRGVIDMHMRSKVKPRLDLTREEFVSWCRLAKSLRLKLAGVVSNPDDLLPKDGRALRSEGKTLELLVPGRNPRRVTPQQAADVVNVTLEELEGAMKPRGYAKRSFETVFELVPVNGVGRVNVTVRKAKGAKS